MSNSDTIIPALIVFGILLLIALYGLFMSNNAAKRHNATTPHPDFVSENRMVSGRTTGFVQRGQAV